MRFKFLQAGLIFVFVFFGFGCKKNKNTLKGQNQQVKIDNHNINEKKETLKKNNNNKDKNQKKSKSGNKLLWKNDFSNIDDPYCPQKKVISNPDKNEPYYPIWVAYKNVLMSLKDPANEEKYFQGFYSVFNEGHKEKWVKNQYWPRVKIHIKKYTRSSDDPSFMICKIIKNSDTNYKFFIKSFDPKKSNHPIIVKKIDGRWVIDFFSY